MSHPVILRGFHGGPPLIVERTDQRFIPSTLKVASEADPLGTFAAQKSIPQRDSDHNLLLYQPVHRAFNLALCEVVCDQFGEPRLDVARIESAGFVVRRVRRSNQAKGGPAVIDCNQAWVQSEHVLRGWLDLDGNADLDPDPARRVEPFHAGQPEMRRLLAGLSHAPPLSESTTTMFPAAKDVCEQARRTLLFGVVPVTSIENAEASPQLVAARTIPYDDDEVEAQLPIFLKPGPERSVDGIGGATVDKNWSNDTSVYVAKYVLFLRTMQIFFDVLGASAESVALRNLLAQVKVYFGNTSASALDHVRDACNIVVNRQDGTTRIPNRWGGISTDLGARLRQAVANAMSSRASAVLPAEGRFEDENARYRLRAFVRVRNEDGCPPTLVWSEASPPFAIVPWFESGKLPPVKVKLPSVTPANISKFKPNVAFQVPRYLFNFLNNNSPKNLLEGNARPGDEGGIDWICGFNIPIITLCAFIILFIFLTLLNIVFWWLPFIRICIPLPRKAKH